MFTPVSVSGGQDDTADSQQEGEHARKLLVQLARSSAEERRVQLAALRTHLVSAACVPTSLLLAGLQHISGDVQRIALDGVLQHQEQIHSQSNEVLAVVSAIIRKCVGAPLTSLSAARTCGVALRTLAVLVRNENVPLTATETQSIIHVLLLSLNRGLERNNDRKAVEKRRSGPGTAFSFGREGASQHDSDWRITSSVASEAMNSRSSPITRPRSLRKPTSSSSLDSNAAQSIASAGWDSESAASASERDAEQPEDDKRNIAAAFRTIRHQSIACLDALNATKAKLLLLHWPTILCEEGSGRACLLDVVSSDQAISNCIAACRTFEAFIEAGASLGFFAGAEERSRLNAFTSLSSRIAATIVQSRSRLLMLLNRKTDHGAAGITEAILRCTTTLVRATGFAKLRQSHSEVLRPVALEVCASKDAAIAVRGYGLLTSLISGEKAAQHGVVGGDILQTLRDPSTPASVKAEAWSALAALAGSEGFATGSEKDTVLSLALQNLTSQTNEDVRQAVAGFVFADVKHQFSSELHAHIDLLCQDIVPPIRVIAADCLAAVAPGDPRLGRLAIDEDSTVRASAARAIGVATQQSGSAVQVNALRTALHDRAHLVRQRASWSWGNLCEAQASVEYLPACIALRHDDERIAIHAARGIGAILAGKTSVHAAKDEQGETNDADEVANDSGESHRAYEDKQVGLVALQTHESLVVDSLAWLRQVLLTNKGPKMRWNTCAALGRILASDTRPYILRLDKQHHFRFLPLLSGIVVQDKMFKTRLTACHALIAVFEPHREHTDPDDQQDVLADVRQDISTTIEQIGEQVGRASFKESQLHAIPLQHALDKLTLLLKSARA